jgi:hypothetical protein
VIRARLGYFAGVLLIAVGIYLALGLGWGLVSLGLGTAAAFVWLYDVAEPTEPIQTRDEGWM